MAKKKRPAANEDHLHLPTHSAASTSSAISTIVDTHTHLLSTFSVYRQKYAEGKYETVFDFAKGLYRPSATSPAFGLAQSQNGPGKKHEIESIVDVWCEAPVRKEWKELADAAIGEGTKANWGGMEYWFVIGLSFHLLRCWF